MRGTRRYAFRFGLALLTVALLVGADATPSKSPNLLANGDLEQAKKLKDKEVPVGWEQPDGVRVCWGDGLGASGSRGIRIEMDEKIAFGYGQGCFSNPVPVETDTEYQVSVDVKSDAPNAIIFVKGFARVGGRWREVYSKHKEAHFDRYLAKHMKSGEFVRQTFSFHPRHDTFQVEHVKVWLYGYLKPGRLWFDNVRLEKVGKAPPESKPAPPEKRRRPRPPDPDGDTSPPIYLDPKTVSR